MSQIKIWIAHSLAAKQFIWLLELAIYSLLEAVGVNGAIAGDAAERILWAAGRLFWPPGYVGLWIKISTILSYTIPLHSSLGVLLSAGKYTSAVHSPTRPRIFLQRE